MTPEAQRKLEEKTKRIYTTIRLEEPDRVPIQINGNIFAAVDAGYTAAEIIYDTSLEKMKDAAVKFMQNYDPDFISPNVGYAGEGPAMDIMMPKCWLWAGMPDSKIDENSLQQFIEYPILMDDEYDFFFSDRTGWAMKKSLPRVAKYLEPLANISVPFSTGPANMIIGEFSKPEVKEMIQTFWKLNDFYNELRPKQAAIKKAIMDMGYPDFSGGPNCAVPFDQYSDFLRGTILSLCDLYERTEEVERFLNERQPLELAKIRACNRDGRFNGKFCYMMLHKGVDGFMGDEHYEKYYWKHLQEIICTIIECGMIPHIFYEGKYSSRLDFLGDIPKGKAVYKFEDTPPELVKKKLGDKVCLTGMFPNQLLDYGTKDEVVDEVKRLIDICAPGGGYIFQTNASLCGNSKKENVVAMFETVKEYGRY